MTAILSNTCDEFTISSNQFNATNIANELTLVHNGTTYEVTVANSNTAPVIVDADTLELESLPQGVYLVTLKTTNEGSVVTTEQVCVASICDLHCDIMPLYTDTTNIEKILAYEALKIASDCVSCSCTTMQRLYDIATETTNATKCNCH